MSSVKGTRDSSSARARLKHFFIQGTGESEMVQWQGLKESDL